MCVLCSVTLLRSSLHAYVCVCVCVCAQLLRPYPAARYPAAIRLRRSVQELPHDRSGHLCVRLSHRFIATSTARENRTRPAPAPRPPTQVRTTSAFESSSPDQYVCMHVCVVMCCVRRVADPHTDSDTGAARCSLVCSAAIHCFDFALRSRYWFVVVLRVVSMRHR